MTTDELLAELADRGLTLILGEDGPRLRGPRTMATPTLLAVLRWHREEITRRLGGLPEREWLWRTGHRYRARPHRDDWHPVGAWWWRYPTETGWRVVPGREQVADVGRALLDGAGLPEGERLANALEQSA